MANVLSKLYEHLCGLTFPRWVSSTGPGPARCPVCGKAILNRRQVAPSSSQPKALKRRCPLPEGPTTGDDPSGSPEHSRKRPALMLPPGDSGLEFARSPSTPSCQLGSSLQISTLKTPAQLEEQKSPYDVPLPDPRGTEVKGLEDPDGELKILEAHKGEAQGRGPPSHGAMALGSWVTIRRDFTLSGHCPSPHQGIVPNVERDEKLLVSPVGIPSHGCDIPTSQSSIVDTLDNNELQNGSHSQESGEVVEGQKPTASPPPASQKSGEVAEDQKSTASPPPDSQESVEVVEDQKSTASPPPDSQESVEVVEDQKSTASPPPDSQESGEVVGGQKPTASPPTDSQKSGEVVEGHKPTASPPPDSQESAKGVVGKKPKELPPPDTRSP
ncbi:basic salivary proline-rich protein 2-like [Perognathus longimembris pacificus]|uniref:basic salivary proline-rich protein 2-like n=1 Tax=Perognathus longimembris pacificus TaxID=214514 RepID=UPI00201949A7|nr:basic salivary proline-rich protein 2-like [Perognathus longimembris pacificus]